MEMNPFEVLIVQGQLEKFGVKDYTLQQGNGCIWARHGYGNFAVNEYYIFRDGKLVDIQVD